MAAGLPLVKSTFTKVGAKNRQKVNLQFTMERYHAVIIIDTLVVDDANTVKI